ncbi:hypothetical protein TEQG_07221 [Trichophyton equinum CBS 127.97]|uniref:Uncharacterized protein n=1 Tax=Trichophyton equinum (strain ATCC MYA-4606 / CBS 127.97) TaxID=559882 RepID=F2Q2C5_TRIEC|nr:hypothetical protein TEQG_07221 [Trichophyton equinum CBS 127.97]
MKKAVPRSIVTKCLSQGPSQPDLRRRNLDGGPPRHLRSIRADRFRQSSKRVSSAEEGKNKYKEEKEEEEEEEEDGEGEEKEAKARLAWEACGVASGWAAADGQDERNGAFSCSAQRPAIEISPTYSHGC